MAIWGYQYHRTAFTQAKALLWGWGGIRYRDGERRIDEYCDRDTNHGEGTKPKTSTAIRPAKNIPIGLRDL